MSDNGSCISAVRPHGVTTVSVSVCGPEYGGLICFRSIVRTLLEVGLPFGLLLSVLHDASKDVGECNG